MVVKYIIVVLLIISAAVFGFQPVKDTDFGWHYRCGKELLAGNPCLENNYSYFLPDYRAYNPSFLYDALIFIVYNAAGFVGLSIFGALVIAVSTLLIYKLLEGPLWFRTLSPLLVLLTPGPALVLGLRSQVFSFLFFLFAVYLIKKRKEDIRSLCLLPPLFFLWVNSHIGYISGLLLLPCFLADEFFTALINKKTILTHRLKWVTLITLLAGLATFISPFGPKVYLEILRHAQAPLGTTIAEWVAPPDWLKLLVAIFTVELLFLLYSRRRLTPFAFFSLVGFAVLTFTGIRNLIFFSTLFLIYTGETISFWRTGKAVKFLSLLNLKRINLGLALFFPLIFLYLHAGQINKTIIFDTSWENYCNHSPVTYPCQFTGKYKNLSGNLYAMYEWGGFLIWQLPKTKVFADGRTPAWLDSGGYSTYQVLLAILQTRPGWNDKLKETKTDYLLISPGTFMDLLLKENPEKYGWREEFRDGASVFYKRI